MDKFFNILKEENPRLLLKIYNSIEELESSLNIAQTYNLDFKNHKEIKKFYEDIIYIKKEIPIEGIQLSMNILDHEKNFSKFVNLFYDFSYTKPKSFSIYKGKNIEVNSFKDLYENILLYFFKLNSNTMYTLINRTKFNGEFRPYFGKDGSKMISPFKISEKLYAETHFSANKIAQMLIKIFNLYNIDINHLRIFLKYDRKEKFNYYK